MVHKPIPIPEMQWKIVEAKAALDKECENMQKLPAWDESKVITEGEVIRTAKLEGKKVHFTSLMDFCHLKNCELEKKLQKYDGKVVLRVDTVKNDSGFTLYWRSKVLQRHTWRRQKVLDVISILPGCSGPASDAVSAYTQVEIKDAP